MSYADDPQRLARLLRDLAQALEDAGVNASGATNERHLMDDARSAARDLEGPDAGRKPGRFAGF
ncbi:hypothetical protein OG963_43050 (plasmid) [Streptomyces sp. NBC_01707]|uniref:hypothetical protein n=1 Tax=Streptomyces sp. NBC_01707 TaxID=2975914 RepID=UPI002F917C33